MTGGFGAYFSDQSGKTNNACYNNRRTQHQNMAPVPEYRRPAPILTDWLCLLYLGNGGVLPMLFHQWVMDRLPSFIHVFPS